MELTPSPLSARRPSGASAGLRGLAAVLVASSTLGAPLPAPLRPPTEDPDLVQRVQDMLRRVAEIPLATYTKAHPASRPALRRTHDLVALFFEGAGRLAPDDRTPFRLAPGITLSPLPWEVAWPEASPLVTWWLGGETEEAARGLVLRRGQSWCTPLLTLEPGSRLRLEAGALETGRDTRLELSWRPEGGSVQTFLSPVAAPATLSNASPLDQALPAGRGSLCLLAREPLFVGEPRILAPEPEGTDPRPRWIVLTILDALRADVLTGPNAARDVPTVLSLAARGQRYDNVLSPGAHTKAAVWPLLMGRDPMRINPHLPARHTQAPTPLPLVYSRGNLFVSHLAESAGYHSVFLGNNAFFRGIPAFSRYANRGRPDTGTVDTIRELPGLFRRYADERILLVYYVSAPHGQSWTPGRLFRELGCDPTRLAEVARCAYSARARHADEAVAAFEAALEDHGLAASTFQVLTADHGEVFGDGRRVETFSQGRWWRTDEGHGATCHPMELRVPLVVLSPSASPAVWTQPVSTLDVVPTLSRVLGREGVNHQDGVALAPFGPASRADRPRRFDSYGYCTQSAIQGSTQLLRWEADCGARREIGSERPLPQQYELWTNGRLEATDRDAPDRLASWTEGLLQHVGEILPAESLMLQPVGEQPARLVVTAPEGRIVDFGPSGSPMGLGGVRSQRSDDGHRLVIDLDGFKGRFHVSTWPPLTPVRVDVAGPANAASRTFVGKLQLPLPVSGERIDPAQPEGFWLASSVPPPPAAEAPSLRVWWQTYRSDAVGPAWGITDMDRVLREWGYIR